VVEGILPLCEAVLDDPNDCEGVVVVEVLGVVVDGWLLLFDGVAVGEVDAPVDSEEVLDACAEVDNDAANEAPLDDDGVVG
jgi:hypothetical protein